MSRPSPKNEALRTAILFFLRDNANSTAREIGAACGVAPEWVNSILVSWERKKLVVRQRTTRFGSKGQPPHLWRLNTQANQRTP